MNKSQKDYFQYILAGVILALYFSVIVILIFKPMPPENMQALLILLGALSAAVGAIIGYFYGSSKSSAEKNDIIAQMPPVNPVP